MKKKILLLCLLWLPVVLYAQDESKEQTTKINVDLEIGNLFQLNKTSVKFLKVISDSRCPRQVTCIWQGEAKVLLGIKVNGDYSEKEVTVTGSGVELALSEDIQMQVSHLRPYPEKGINIAPEEYRLRFAAVFPKEN